MSKVAFVTGASRGIGAATARRLAELGFDIVLAARTLRPGESRDRYADGTPFSGSLEESAEAVRQCGRRALVVSLDLTDRDSMLQASRDAMAQWGRIDVLVNNALYANEYSNSLLVEIETDAFMRLLEANVVNQLALTQEILSGMRRQGDGGTIINVSSGVTHLHPPAPANQGGWGYAYTALKSAFTQLTPMIQVEHAEAGILAFSVEPGGVATDSFKSAFPPEQLVEFLKNPELGLVSVEVPAQAIGWLATAAEASELSGQTLDCATLCREKKLLSEAQIVANSSTW